jgi:hypothetical protein
MKTAIKFHQNGGLSEVSGSEEFVVKALPEQQKTEKQKPSKEFNCTKLFLFTIVILIAVLISRIDLYDFVLSQLREPFTFWFIAVVWSGFLGIYAFEIHFSSYDYHTVTIVQAVHQFIFNFGLAFAGWLIFYRLLHQGIPFEELQTSHTILIGIIAVSLSGYLPYMVTQRNPSSQ